MSVQTSDDLKRMTCKPCEGGVDKMTPEEARRQLDQLDGWQLSEDGTKIFRKWKLKNFVEGMELLNRAAEIAEAEQHHPDLHLEGYRHVRIELSTHAIGGLSENDFIVAAKIG